MAGCSVVCKGPACEDSFPGTAVAVHRGLLPDTERSVTRGQGSYQGTEEQGNDWAIAALSDTLFFGQPDADTVVASPDRFSSGPVATAATWSEPATGFGHSVALAEISSAPDTGAAEAEFDLWVGAPEDQLERGAVYIYRSQTVAGGGGDGASADRVLRGMSIGDRLGWSLHPCGDLDGDGAREVLVTSPWFILPDVMDTADEVPGLAGAVFLVLSSRLRAQSEREPELLDVALVWWGEQIGEQAGAAVACGDFDGDNADDDLAIGAPFYGSRADDNQDAGRVYFILGARDAAELPPSGPLSTSADAILEAPDRGGWFGIALTPSHILGGAAQELAVGAAGSDGGRGRVHVYRGDDLALELEGAVDDKVIEPKRLAVIAGQPGRDAGDHFGRSLVAGDLDGRGMGDLVVGAPDFRIGRNTFGAGRVWVWFGETAEWTLAMDADSAASTITSTQSFARVGRDMRTVDLDVDGRAELVLPTRILPRR